MENISIGIIAGIIATFIVFVFSTIWKKILIPWYEERIYKDVKIEGKWEGIMEYDGAINKDIIIINRESHSISGTIKTIEGPNKGGDYIFKGSFKNLILTASYRASDRFQLDRGSFSLILKENGKKFEGRSSFYDDSTNKIDNCKYSFTKI